MENQNYRFFKLNEIKLITISATISMSLISLNVFYLDHIKYQFNKTST